MSKKLTYAKRGRRHFVGRNLLGYGGCQKLTVDRKGLAVFIFRASGPIVVVRRLCRADNERVAISEGGRLGRRRERGCARGGRDLEPGELTAIKAPERRVRRQEAGSLSDRKPASCCSPIRFTCAIFTVPAVPVLPSAMLRFDVRLGQRFHAASPPSSMKSDGHPEREGY